MGFRVTSRGDSWEVAVTNLWGSPRLEDFYVARSEEEAKAFIEEYKAFEKLFQLRYQSKESRSNEETMRRELAEVIMDMMTLAHTMFKDEPTEDEVLNIHKAARHTVLNSERVLGQIKWKKLDGEIRYYLSKAAGREDFYAAYKRDFWTAFQWQVTQGNSSEDLQQAVAHPARFKFKEYVHKVMDDYVIGELV